MSNLSRLYDVELDEPLDSQFPAKPKRSLADFLELMRRAESEVEDSEIDLAELGVDLRSKVDQIVDFLDYCDERAHTLRSKMKLFEAKAKAFENRSKSLRQYLADTMAFDAELKGNLPGEAKGKHLIPGENYQMRLQFHEYVDVSQEPDPVAFLKLGPRFVERRYAWNKRALKMALENNSALVGEFAALKKRPHVKVEVKTQS